MTTYDITISEDQRIRLVEALELLYLRDQTSENEMLLGLTKELPESERQSPHIHHGFCY